MEINTVVVLKHPVARVWQVMRDELDGLVGPRDGIRELAVLQRAPGEGGRLRVVSQWQAEVAVPALAAPYVDADMFRWVDDAVWDEPRRECRWRITPHQFAERIDCAGITRFAPALGGQGSRVTLQGEFRWDLRGVIELPPGVESGVARGIEAFLGGQIPRNFRKITEAARRHLENGGGILK